MSSSKKLLVVNPTLIPNQEIERRFLVEAVPADFENAETHAVEQGYISADPAVRLRQIDERQFFMTIERGTGAVREEREVELTPDQFAGFWPLTDGWRPRKIRRSLPWKSHLIELDSFLDRHHGLHIAEVEFPDESAMHAFLAPPWFGRELTGDSAYANVNLARP